MKKIIIGLLLIIFSNAYATAACKILKVAVKNDSPSTCYLVERTIKSGSIHKRFLYRISPGVKITQFEILEGYKKPASILLTYECGDNRSISFLSTKDACVGNHAGKIEGTVVAATNMTAVFTTSLEKGYYLANSIDWIIS